MIHPLSDADKRVLTTAIDGLSFGILRDKCHAQANRTRLLRWYCASGLPLDAFMALVREAHSRIIARQFELERAGAYWFRVLAELIAKAMPEVAGEPSAGVVSPGPARMGEGSKDVR